MLLYVFLEILVRTPLKKQLDPLGVQLLLEGGPYGPLRDTFRTQKKFSGPFSRLAHVDGVILLGFLVHQLYKIHIRPPDYGVG